jgi:hypothetical protein
MRIGAYAMIVIAATLAGCGGGRNGEAADACVKTIAEKLQGKIYEVDRGDMIAHIRSESDDVVVVSSNAIFNRKMSGEYQQAFDCRVRFETGKPPSVIGFQFDWNTDDLKKSQQ